MNAHIKPDSAQKLAQIGDLMRFEPAGDRPLDEKALRQVTGAMSCITNVSTPTGAMPILKSMVTTACEKNCYYCPFRAGRSEMRRVTFQPDEMARTFDLIQRAGLARGLFLSSGIVKGGVTTQDKIIDTAEILRNKYGYQGYLHLKIMPGAEMDQIRRAMQLASRVSINLEGPTPERLERLAPKKDFGGELLDRLDWAHRIRAEGDRSIRASIVTQFVVGAVGDTDLELLSVSERLYRQFGLKRAYYMGFNPIRGTPFEDLTPTDPARERRLYQASFLLRDYDWELEDLPFTQDANLRLDADPKRAWADAHLRAAPVELNLASRRDLLRVPGIGPAGADAILKARQRGALSDLAHLRAIGLRAVDAIAPYILLAGRRPEPPSQPRLPGMD